MRNILIIGEQLFSVFGQTVTTVTKRGIVVVAADAGVQADTLNNLFGIQPVGSCIGVQLIEISYTHRKVGISKKFDRLGLG